MADGVVAVTVASVAQPLLEAALVATGVGVDGGSTQARAEPPVCEARSNTAA